MQKSRAERLKGIFKDIDKKSEAEKARLVWYLASFCACGVFCIWLASTGSSLSQLGSGGVDLSQLPAFPQLEPINLDEALQKSGEALDDYEKTSNAAWQERGSKYVAEQDVLAGDDFSTLKLAEVRKEEGAVILRYEHYYKEVPVLGSGLVLAADAKSEEISTREDNLKRGINLAVDPAISAKDAAALASKNTDGNYAFSEAQLAIAEYEDNFYLVWKTVFRAEAGEEKTILVGAQHGGIIPGDSTGGNQASNMTE